MNEQTELETSEVEASKALEIPDQDDRYPGSFFRIPGRPSLENTGWQLN
ncbi:MAG: hypothetical protein NTY69_10170 [Methylococcales bacterium]|nr:hypothetical protein [Methylococcales bacterium]